MNDQIELHKIDFPINGFESKFYWPSNFDAHNVIA